MQAFTFILRWTTAAWQHYLDLRLDRIDSTTAHCDTLFLAPWKYSYLLTYLLTRPKITIVPASIPLHHLHHVYAKNYSIKTMTSRNNKVVIDVLTIDF